MAWLNWTEAQAVGDNCHGVADQNPSDIDQGSGDGAQDRARRTTGQVDNRRWPDRIGLRWRGSDYCGTEAGGEEKRDIPHSAILAAVVSQR